MSEKILVPILGESITEATVSKWLKKEGENVEADEPIVELETDKVNLEVPSPISGVLSQIDSKDGTIVQVGATLGSISSNGSSLEKNVENQDDNPELDKDNIVSLDYQKKEEPQILEKKGEPHIFEEEEEESL